MTYTIIYGFLHCQAGVGVMQLMWCASYILLSSLMTVTHTYCYFWLTLGHSIRYGSVHHRPVSREYCLLNVALKGRTSSDTLLFLRAEKRKIAILLLLLLLPSQYIPFDLLILYVKPLQPLQIILAKISYVSGIMILSYICLRSISIHY